MRVANTYTLYSRCTAVRVTVLHPLPVGHPQHAPARDSQQPYADAILRRLALSSAANTTKPMLKAALHHKQRRKNVGTPQASPHCERQGDVAVHVRQDALAKPGRRGSV